MKDTVTLWHNPRCSKSREALALLRAHGLEPTIVEYLKQPPTVPQLDHVLMMLGIQPRQLLRMDEAVWSQVGGDEPGLDRDALVAAMAAHPILIQRPIAIRGDRAVLGRPPERVLDLL